jgi:hypothetical protein
MRMRKAAAEIAIERMNLGHANQILSGYWLSLWQGDSLPRREQFDPMQVKSLLANLMVFDVVPDNAVTVRSAGSDLKLITGDDLNGRDWVARAPLRLQNMRMRNLTAVTQGAILWARRRIYFAGGVTHYNEELVLPFAPNADGQCSILAYPDWKLDAFNWRGERLNSERCARYHRIFPLSARIRDDEMPTGAV